MGTTTEPVTGSGACPAWMAAVSNFIGPRLVRDDQPLGERWTTPAGRAQQSLAWARQLFLRPMWSEGGAWPASTVG